MVMCWASNCKHYNQRETCKFFRFSYANKEERRIWQNLVGRHDEPGPGAYLCSCHFPDGNRENGPLLCKLGSSVSLQNEGNDSSNLNSFVRNGEVNNTDIMSNPDIIIPEFSPLQQSDEEAVMVERNNLERAASSKPANGPKWIPGKKTLLCMSHFEPGRWAKKSTESHDMDFNQLEDKDARKMEEDQEHPEDSLSSHLLFGDSPQNQELQIHQIWLEEKNQDDFISEAEEVMVSDEETPNNEVAETPSVDPLSIITSSAEMSYGTIEPSSSVLPSCPTIKQEPIDMEEQVSPPHPPSPPLGPPIVIKEEEEDDENYYFVGFDGSPDSETASEGGEISFLPVKDENTLPKKVGAQRPKRSQCPFVTKKRKRRKNVPKDVSVQSPGKLQERGAKKEIGRCALFKTHRGKRLTISSGNNSEERDVVVPKVKRVSSEAIVKEQLIVPKVEVDDYEATVVSGSDGMISIKQEDKIPASELKSKKKRWVYGIKKRRGIKKLRLSNCNDSSISDDQSSSAGHNSTDTEDSKTESEKGHKDSKSPAEQAPLIKQNRNTEDSKTESEKGHKDSKSPAEQAPLIKNINRRKKMMDTGVRRLSNRPNFGNRYLYYISNEMKRKTVRKKMLEAITCDEKTESFGDEGGGEEVVIDNRNGIVKQDDSRNSDAEANENNTINVVSLASLFGDGTTKEGEKGAENESQEYNQATRSLIKQKYKVNLPSPPAHGILKTSQPTKTKSKPCKSVSFSLPSSPVKEDTALSDESVPDPPSTTYVPITPDPPSIGPELSNSPGPSQAEISQRSIPKKPLMTQSPIKHKQSNLKSKKRKKFVFSKRKKRSVTSQQESEDKESNETPTKLREPPDAPEVTKTTQKNNEEAKVNPVLPEVSQIPATTTYHKQQQVNRESDLDNEMANTMHSYGKTPADMQSKKKPWSFSNLKSACQAVNNKEMGTFKAGKIFGVPRSTIRDHLKRKETPVEITIIEEGDSDAEFDRLFNPTQAKISNISMPSDGPLTPMPSDALIKVKPLEKLIDNDNLRALIKSTDSSSKNEEVAGKKIKIEVPVASTADCIDDDPIRLYKFCCQKCNYRAEVVEDIRAHLLERHSNQKTCCPYCRISMDSMLLLMAHFDREHQLKKGFNEMFDPSQGNEWLVLSKENLVRCSICTFTAIHYTVLIRHFKLSHCDQKYYICMFCSFRSVNLVELLIHISTLHAVGYDTHCAFCTHATHTTICLHVPDYSKPDIASRPYCCQSCSFSSRDCELFLKHAVETHLC